MKRFKKAMKAIALALAVGIGMPALPAMQVEAAEYEPITSADFLRASGKNLVNANGEVVNLRGTNAGGYLLQEFWMTPTKATTNVADEEDIYAFLTERFGEEAMYEIVDAYQDSYWTEADFDNCARLGMNVIRLPFWWRNLVDENGVFYGYEEAVASAASASEGDVSGGNSGNADPYAKAFERMDWFVAEAAERGMYVIIDFHGAPGSQNGSDHSGVDGGNDKMGASQFWFAEASKKEWYHQLYYDMWEVIAERYAGNPAVAGYDLMNEPYCTWRYHESVNADDLHAQLWDVYDKAYDVIRAVDPDHVIIMEATWDPVDLPNPAQYGWTNIMYEYHNYLYDDYDNANGQQIANMENKLNAIANADYEVPSYMGEFSYFNSPDAWDEGLELLVNSGINWTTWTYKTTADYGMWGHFHHLEEFNSRINLETATKDEIIAWYSRMDESTENTALTAVTSKWYKVPTVANTMGPKYAEIDNGDYYLVGNNTMMVLTGDETTGLVAATDSPYAMGEEADQLFTLVNNDDDTVSLKAANGKYISVNTTDKKMYATASEIGDTEKFYVLTVSKTTVAFKSKATGTYVQVVNPKIAEGQDAPESFEVLVQSFAITGDESFQLYDTDKSLLGSVKLPTYSGWTRYEAEDENVATIVGGAKNSDVSEYSGGYAAGSMNSKPQLADVAADWSNLSHVKYTVNVPVDGEYLLSLNYNGNDDKTILVKVGADGNQTEVFVPNRAGGEWNNLYEQIIKVTLKAGSNDIYISGTINDTGWINQDCIDLIDAPLGTNDVYTRYEAENYYTNATIKEQTHFSGGKGAENINSDTSLENVAFNWSNIKYVDFTVYVEEAGEYTLVLGYTGAGTNGMTALYRLNNGANQVMTLDNEGGNWNICNTYTTTVTFEKGFNDLKISGTIITTDHYANIDYIDIKPASVEETPKDPSGPSGWTHIEAEKTTIVRASKETQDFYSMGMGVGSFDTSSVALDEVADDWSNIKYISFDVEAPVAGDYRMVFAYNGDDNKSGLVRVNGGDNMVIELPNISPDYLWSNMHEKELIVTLEEGTNTVWLSGAVGGGWYNVDYLEIANSPIVVVDEETQTERYEAEFFDFKSNKAADKAIEVQNGDVLKYSGPNAEGVGGLGTPAEYEVGENILDTGLSYVNFSVYAKEAGNYTVKLACNGNGADMVAVYQVNDGQSQNYDIKNSGASWDTLCYSELTVTLEKGLNQLIITGPYDSWDNWINFDYIDVTPVVEDDDDNTGDDDTNTGDDDTNTGDDDTNTGDDDNTDDDDTNTGDDDTNTGDDDTNTGDDDTNTGDDDTNTGDDDTNTDVKPDEGSVKVEDDASGLPGFEVPRFTEMLEAIGNNVKADATIKFEVEKKEPLDKAEQDAVNAVLGDKTIGITLDITLYADGTQITELNQEIELKISIPFDLRKVNRVFSVYRIHNGVAEKLPVTEANAAYIKVKTDKFSTYVLAYEDDVNNGGATTVVPGNNGTAANGTNAGGATIAPQSNVASPNTGDSISPLVWALLVLIAGVVIVGATKVYFAKKELDTN